MPIDEKALNAAEKAYRYHYEGRPMLHAIEAYEAAKAPVSINDTAKALWVKEADEDMPYEKQCAEIKSGLRCVAMTCAKLWRVPYVN